MTDTTKPIIPQGPGIWLTDAEHRALLDAKEAAERRAYDLAVAIMGGEDAPGYADSIPTEVLVKQQRDMALDWIETTDLKVQLAEARASAAASWEACLAECADAALNVKGGAYANAYKAVKRLTNPDPSATEALRHVKEAVWAEGFNEGYCGDVRAATNPYAAKEAAHG